MKEKKKGSFIRKNREVKFEIGDCIPYLWPGKTLLLISFPQVGSPPDPQKTRENRLREMLGPDTIACL